MLQITSLVREPDAASAPDGAPPVLRRAGQDAMPVQDFVDALLAALTGMAGLSPRRQADVAVAMRRSGLTAPADAVQAALDQLRRDGCVDRPLHLSDGGILVSVTAHGIERLAMTAHRHVVAAMMMPPEP